MRPPAVHVLAAIGAAALLAGCGGKKAQPQAATTAPTPAEPGLTAPADVAACSRLETNIRVISQLISASVEAITQSQHPPDLAKRTGETRQNLLLAAKVLAGLQTPESIRAARNDLVAGLRKFAADFGRAQRSAARNDLATAASQLVDRAALATVTSAAQAIDRACGA